MSSKELTYHQRSVLSKGLNFALAPRKIPIPRIIAAVENGLRCVDESLLDNFRQKVIGLLKSAKLPPQNLTPEESKALRMLKQDGDLTVLVADKGKATVVMDRCKYDEKMNTLLSDQSTYKVLRNDPTPSLQRKMNSLLLQLKKDKKLPCKTYNELRCTSGRTPSIYGLPKVHKPGIPMRPIV